MYHLILLKNTYSIGLPNVLFCQCLGAEGDEDDEEGDDEEGVDDDEGEQEEEEEEE